MTKNSLFVLLTLLFLAFSAHAQTINGSVTDQNGAAIRDAEITVATAQKEIARTKSGADGAFSIESENEIDAAITVRSTGFRPFSKRVGEIDGVLKVVLVVSGIDEFAIFSIARDDSRLPETPASVVVISRENLQTSAALRIDDALRQVPGFTLFRRGSSRTSNPTTQGANLRGLAGSGASRVNVLLDGFSLNDAFGGWTYWSRVPSAAIEEVEVLRGGASAFYGDQGLSGAVILRSSRFESKPVFRLEMSAGSQKTFDGSVFAAYGRKDWSGDVAVQQSQTGGYVPTAEAERGTVDTRAGSRFRNSVFRVSRKFRDDARSVFVRGNLFGENRDNGTSLTNNGTYFRQFAAGADFFGFRFRAFLEKQTYNQTFSAISNNRNTETLSRVQRVPSQAFGANLAWSRPVGVRHTLSASAEFRDAKGFSNEQVFGGGRVTTFVGSGGAQRSFGFFAQDIWQVKKNLNISASGRLDHFVNYGALSSSTTAATLRTTTTSFIDRNETAFSPRIAALYRVSDNVSLVASYATSFRSPTLNELYRAFRVGNVLTLANENLRSESADSFDAGARFSGFSGKLNLRSNVFYALVDRPVVSVTLSTTSNLITRQRQNSGKTRAAGFEADFAYKPIRLMEFTAGCIFSDSRFVGENRFVPQVARSQFTFQGSFRPTRKLTLSVQGRVSGRQFEDDLNSLILRRYATFDVFASYRFRRVEMFATTENVANSRYDLGLTPNLTVAGPRFLRAGLRLNFGR